MHGYFICISSANHLKIEKLILRGQFLKTTFKIAFLQRQKGSAVAGNLNSVVHVQNLLIQTLTNVHEEK